MITPRSRRACARFGTKYPSLVCLSPRRTVNSRWLRNFARERRRRELLELEQKGTRERMQNRARRGVRRTNYQKITRQSILSSVARTKKAGRGTGRKFTSKDLAGVPLSPPVLSMRSHARCPEWRDTQKAARHRNYSGQSSLHAEAGAIFYSISSAGCDGCRDGQRRKIAMKKRKTRVTPVVRKFSCQVPRDMGSVYDMRNRPGNRRPR